MLRLINRSLRLPGLPIAVAIVASAVTMPELGAQAPASGDSIALSLDDALRRGMERNEDIGVARSRVRGAGAQRSAARSVFLPQITSQSSYSRTLRGPFSDLGRSVRSGTGSEELGSLFDELTSRKNSYSNSLGASQVLFNKSALANLRATRELEQVHELQLTERELEVSLEIVQAYYGAVLADRIAEISVAALESANEHLDHVRRTRSAGNASDLDVLSVEVQRDNLEPDRIQALNARDQALRNLDRLIGLGAEGSLRLTDVLNPKAFAAVPRATLDSVARSALGRRAGIAAADHQIRVNKLRESGAKAAWMPSIVLGASFAKQGAWANGAPDGEDLRDDWSLSVAIQSPLFDGGQRKADVAQARELAVQSQLQHEQLKKAVLLEVAQQRGELDRAAVAVAARSQTAATAAHTYSLATLAYEKGVVNTLQLSDSRLQLRQARVNEVQALHDYYVALARLRRAAGHTPHPMS